MVAIAAAAPLLFIPRAPPPRALAASNRVLLDFTDPSLAMQWAPVDDRIMGGASTSQITHTDGLTTFSGDLIVEGGGFASARFEQPFALGRDVEALELEAEGDGRLGYKLTLRSAAADASVSYQFALPGDGTKIRLPLSGFRATCRGQPAPEAPPLRAEDVCGLGLMLSRYEVDGTGVKASIPAGAFCLKLRRLSTAPSELAINGRRWLRPRGSGPSMLAADAAGTVVTLADCEAAAARLGCALTQQGVGPAFRVELAWEGGRALAGGDPQQPELLGYSEGFSQPTGVVHLESLQVRRFSGYWSRSRSARYEAAPRPLSDQGLGVLLSTAVACWILERDPFKCARAQLLAINDNPRQGRVLARYYRRLGFATLREVGDAGGFGDFADQVVWGGVGTLMEVDVAAFARKWGGAVREMELDGDAG